EFHGDDGGPSAAQGQAPSASATVRDVPDHILERIFLRLGSSAHLVRAASACKRWRRVVADRDFQARFRSLRAPLVAGHYHTVDPDRDDASEQQPSGGRPARPVFVPSPTLTVDRRRFSLDFLPVSNEWEWGIVDSRGGLLLLRSKTWRRWKRPTCFYPDLVVCEPLTRRHQSILLPSCLAGHGHLGFFLVNGDTSGGRGGSGSIGMSSFKEAGRNEPVSAVFSSGNDGGWRLRQLSSASRNNGGISIPKEDSVTFLGRANGSFYWGTGEGGAMLVLDEATAEFTSAMLPEDVRDSYDGRTFGVVGGEDGGVRVVCVIDNELRVYARINDGGDLWFAEKILRLPEATSRLPGRKVHYFQDDAVILSADDTYILLTPQEETWPFSVELETMDVERAQDRNRYAGPAYPCELPWPPALGEASSGGRRRRSCR
ncbi:hypothetical protein EJB05_53717, partial [Eragrostis curvula]